MRVAVLTVSDGCFSGEREDRSGDLIAQWCTRWEYELTHRDVVPDETDQIIPQLVRWADSGDVDVVLTTGGTGFSPRDVTPEATRSVLDKEAPGLADAIRREGLPETPTAVLSRGLVGSRAVPSWRTFRGAPAASKTASRRSRSFFPTSWSCCGARPRDIRFPRHRRIPHERRRRGQGACLNPSFGAGG